MRSLVAMMVFLLVVSVGCDSNSRENEAVERAKENWKLTELGGAFYICEITRDYQRNESKTVYELRNVRFEASSRPLSAADKLNGVEWTGWVHLKVDAFRSCTSAQDSGRTPGGTWSAWISTEPAGKGAMAGVGHAFVSAMIATKTKGAWEVRAAPQGQGQQGWLGLGQIPSFKQVEPSDLPK